MVAVYCYLLKSRTSKQKSLKTKVLPVEQTNDQFDRLAGNIGTPEADNYNQKANKQQQIHDQDVEYEESEEIDSFQILMNWVKQERT